MDPGQHPIRVHTVRIQAQRLLAVRHRGLRLSAVVLRFGPSRIRNGHSGPQLQSLVAVRDRKAQHTIPLLLLFQVPAQSQTAPQRQTDRCAAFVRLGAGQIELRLAAVEPDRLVEVGQCLLVPHRPRVVTIVQPPAIVILRRPRLHHPVDGLHVVPHLADLDRKGQQIHADRLALRHTHQLAPVVDHRAAAVARVDGRLALEHPRLVVQELVTDARAPISLVDLPDESLRVQPQRPAAAGIADGMHPRARPRTGRGQGDLRHVRGQPLHGQQGQVTGLEPIHHPSPHRASFGDQPLLVLLVTSPARPRARRSRTGGRRPRRSFQVRSARCPGPRGSS